MLEVGRKAEVPLFVTYGTLLGWVRETGFIRHDDDIDLGLLDEDWPCASELATDLARKGWTIRWFADDELQVRSDRFGGVALDVFRYRARPDAIPDHFVARAYSDEGTRQHTYSFAADLIAPLCPMQVHGIDTLVPHLPEAFLAAHYGEDWNVPRATWDYRKDAASEQPPP